MTGAEIDRHRSRQPVQRIEGGEVAAGQIDDMDVIAHPGTVGRRVVATDKPTARGACQQPPAPESQPAGQCEPVTIHVEDFWPIWLPNSDRLNCPQLYLHRTFKESQLVRHLRIEAFRVYSIVLILIGHTFYFAEIDLSQPLAKAFAYSIAILARATIPFFFILSGFFLGGKILDAPEKAISIAFKYTWKLGALFLFWSAIYALANPYRSWTLLTENPVRLIFEGTQIHLWFLASLILTVWLFALWPLARKSGHFSLWAESCS